MQLEDKKKKKKPPPIKLNINIKSKLIYYKKTNWLVTTTNHNHIRQG